MRKSSRTSAGKLLSLVVLIGLLAGCQSAYYGAMEKLGRHKRDILVNRIREAADEQEEAKQQFRDALEQFKSVVSVPSGPLEQKYETLRKELEQSEKKAEAVRSRIDGVESVAKDLFREWEDELDQYSDASLRRQSQQQLERTRDRYEDLMRAMHRAESRIEPVLKPLRDQVLFLKHNLNAQAIGAIQGELRGVENDVDTLVREMERAIAEANAFIREMEQTSL